MGSTVFGRVPASLGLGMVRHRLKLYRRLMGSPPLLTLGCCLKSDVPQYLGDGLFALVAHATLPPPNR